MVRPQVSKADSAIWRRESRATPHIGVCDGAKLLIARIVKNATCLILVEPSCNNNGAKLSITRREKMSHVAF